MECLETNVMGAATDRFILESNNQGSNRGFVDSILGPTAVPKPGTSTVTQEHLPRRKSDALRALG